MELHVLGEEIIIVRNQIIQEELKFRPLLHKRNKNNPFNIDISKNTYLRIMAFKDSTDEKFNEQICASKLSLIQFSASWCGPCQQLKPIIEKISDDMSKK